VTETEILVEQPPLREVLVCDHAGHVIDKFSFFPAPKTTDLYHTPSMANSAYSGNQAYPALDLLGPFPPLTLRSLASHSGCRWRIGCTARAPLSLFLSPTHTHTVTLSLTHTLTHTQTLWVQVAPRLYRACSCCADNTHTLSLTVSLSLTHTLTLSLSLLLLY